jgi:hypothetical protein
MDILITEILSTDELAYVHKEALEYSLGIRSHEIRPEITKLEGIIYEIRAKLEKEINSQNYDAELCIDYKKIIYSMTQRLNVLYNKFYSNINETELYSNVSNATSTMTELIDAVLVENTTSMTIENEYDEMHMLTEEMNIATI